MHPIETREIRSDLVASTTTSTHSLPAIAESDALLTEGRRCGVRPADRRVLFKCLILASAGILAVGACRKTESRCQRISVALCEEALPQAMKTMEECVAFWKVLCDERQRRSRDPEARNRFMDEMLERAEEARAREGKP